VISEGEACSRTRLRLRRIVGALAFRIAAAATPNDLKLLNETLPEIEKQVRLRSDQTRAKIALAIIAAEDHRFLSHIGVELRSILRAVGGLLTGSFSGGSTIEQQLIRVVRGRYEFTVWRKLSEILLALALYGRFQKAELAEMYAEIAYYGWRGSGLENISGRLGYRLDQITIDQAVTIACLLKRPLPGAPSRAYLRKLESRIEYVQKRLAQVRGMEAAHGLVERANL
jgi:membrane peptidoglycan carboxypeptidase